jgi:NCS1 family nucleobase:cation symporter-1
VRKGNVHVPSLYNGHKSSPYWYTGGFNLRTFAAWLIAVVSVIHGLAGNFNIHYNKASTNIYSIGMLMSFSIAGPLYYIFNLIWTVEIYPTEHADAPKTREYMGRTDGFFEDEVIVGLEARSSTEGQVVMDKDSKMV